MARISKIRTTASLTRRPGKKIPGVVVYIVCEGETEKIYFEAARAFFGLSCAHVVIPTNTNGSDPINIVDYAYELGKKAQEGDCVFCVMDRDGRKTFDTAWEKIKGWSARRTPLPIKGAVSIPCFEVWVLLHFAKFSTSGLDCHSLEGKIRASHMTTYAKASKNLFAALEDKLEVALANSEWLASQVDVNVYDPFTEIHQLFYKLAAMSQRKSQWPDSLKRALKVK